MSFLYIGFLFLGLILIALFIKIKANFSLSSKLRYIALILLTITLARPILDYSTQKEKIKSVPNKFEVWKVSITPMEGPGWNI